MTVEPTGHVLRFPGPIMQRCAGFTIGIRTPIADSTP